MKQDNLARLLGVSKSYLSMLEKGTRNPSLEVLGKLSSITGIPVDNLISASSAEKDNAAINTANARGQLNREHLEHQRTKERLWELERGHHHLTVMIYFHKLFEDIMFNNKTVKNEKNEQLVELAALAMAEGELNFEEIQNIIRVNRSTLWNALCSKKRSYKCKFTGGEIMALSPGEACLCLHCAECIKFDSGECLGYGNEEAPLNIVDMLERMKVNGIFDSMEQAKFLEKYYDLSFSAQEIINIRHKAKNGQPIPDEIFYMDKKRGTH
jgi:transcriptional regulator with XRE-family HTH domain